MERYMAKFLRTMAVPKKVRASVARTRSRRTKAPYVPGTLGLSAVSQDIRHDYGRIVSRRERRQLARRGGPAFRPYYNWR